MICDKCKSENSDLATFCGHCGARLNSGSATGTGKTNFEGDQAQARHKTKRQPLPKPGLAREKAKGIKAGKKGAKYLPFVIIIGVCVVAAGWYFGIRKPSESIVIKLNSIGMVKRGMSEQEVKNKVSFYSSRQPDLPDANTRYKSLIYYVKTGTELVVDRDPSHYKSLPPNFPIGLIVENKPIYKPYTFVFEDGELAFWGFLSSNANGILINRE